MKNVVAFIKKHWKLLFTLLGLLIGIKIVPKLIARVTEGLTSKPTSFVKVPGNPNAIFVKDGTTWVAHGLSDGVTSDTVKAAAITPSGTVEVTLDHKVTDRKSASGNSDSSLNIG